VRRERPQCGKLNADLRRKVLQVRRCLALGFREKYATSGAKGSKIACGGVPPGTPITPDMLWPSFIHINNEGDEMAFSAVQIVFAPSPQSQAIRLAS
jgi:hypothetical protein